MRAGLPARGRSGDARPHRDRWTGAGAGDVGQQQYDDHGRCTDPQSDRLADHHQTGGCGRHVEIVNHECRPEHRYRTEQGCAGKNRQSRGGMILKSVTCESPRQPRPGSIPPPSDRSRLIRRCGGTRSGHDLAYQSSGASHVVRSSSREVFRMESPLKFRDSRSWSANRPIAAKTAAAPSRWDLTASNLSGRISTR